MKLSLEDVRRVAALARLSLTAEEEQQYQRQLSAILEAFEQLKAVDTTSVAPTSTPLGLSGHLREDEVRPSLRPEQVLANAPSKVGTCFSVPKILE